MVIFHSFLYVYQRVSLSKWDDHSVEWKMEIKRVSKLPNLERKINLGWTNIAEIFRKLHRNQKNWGAVNIPGQSPFFFGYCNPISQGSATVESKREPKNDPNCKGHRTGWWEHLQETTIFDGKNHSFRLRFSLKPIHCKGRPWSMAVSIKWMCAIKN